MNFIKFCGTDFTGTILFQTNTFTLKQKIMSRQNRNQVRDRKTEESKRDVAGSNERYLREQGEETRNEQRREQLSNISGLDKHRLNDLYERSSL
jgi:hypothetical protein